jgi:hypothetical protein
MTEHLRPPKHPALHDRIAMLQVPVAVPLAERKALDE